LQHHLPFIKHYFAIKALRHPAAIAAIKDEGGYFDVITKSDIDLVKDQGINPERCIHTNTIKKPEEIEYALRYGVRTFVVDNFSEIDKFVAHAGKVELLVRLSFQNPKAKSNLSYKFGVPPAEAEELIAYAMEKGLEIAGLSFHVGSQIDRADAYSSAIKATIELIDKIEKERGIRLRILDIGGGFPVNYLESSPRLEEIAKIIVPLLKPLKDRLTIIAEPGRFLVASSMTLFTRVVSKGVRGGRQWYYVDDGLFNSYSNIIFEHVKPPIVALKEVEAAKPVKGGLCVLAGPTGDSVDIIDTECSLPPLEVGDYVVSPMMGAYTVVSATEFNGIPKAQIAVLSKGDILRS
jgi:ornithine decarboxylase